MDVCGVKTAILDAVDKKLLNNGISFIGTHPMAGREYSKFSSSLEYLFDGASMILTPTFDTNQDAFNTVSEFAKTLGFERVIVTSPERHDKLIAYTSQLAHIVSNAYIKSPTQKSRDGFCAGSYYDMTRVARINSAMWTDLFLGNSKNLIFEIENFIKNLKEIAEAIAGNDGAKLNLLLESGNIIKKDE